MTDSDRVVNQIIKDYGEGIVVPTDIYFAQKPKVISVSPAIDSIIGQGIPQGSRVTLSGIPKCGKGITCLHFAAKCQAQGMSVWYIDAEARLQEMNTTGIPGLEPFHHVASSKDRILSCQDFLTIGEKILQTKENVLLIIDSISVLHNMEDRALAEGVTTETRGGGAKYLARFYSQITQLVPVRKHIVISIMQLMANTGGYGPSLVEKGGMAAVYMADVRLRCIDATTHEWRIGADSKGKGGTLLGQKVHWRCQAQCFGPPGGEAESYIRYGKGIDELTECVNIAHSVGLITNAGKWYYLDYLFDPTKDLESQKKIYKADGSDKLYRLLQENPQYIEILNKKLYEVNRS